MSMPDFEPQLSDFVFLLEGLLSLFRLNGPVATSAEEAEAFAKWLAEIEEATARIRPILSRNATQSGTTLYQRIGARRLATMRPETSPFTPRRPRP